MQTGSNSFVHLRLSQVCILISDLSPTALVTVYRAERRYALPRLVTKKSVEEGEANRCLLHSGSGKDVVCKQEGKEGAPLPSHFKMSPCRALTLLCHATIALIRALLCQALSGFTWLYHSL